MKISVVIVSYNQGKFLEETILSVINQDYIDKEIILIDGGSTDDSLEIIKKYKEYFHYWVSQPDNGQSDAIVKGFKICTGEIITWINSDDLLMPNTLELIYRKSIQVKSVDGVFYGGVYIINDKGQPQERYKYGKFNYFISKTIGPTICQPGTFFGKNVYNSIGGINVKLKYGMDYDLFCNFLFSGISFYSTNGYHAKFRRYSAQKGHSKHFLEISLKETELTQTKYGFKGSALFNKIVARMLQVWLRIFNGYYFITFSYRIAKRRTLKQYFDSMTE
ncbi:glycosyltransferase family 2 protein [Asinibacterium sp. OR53]|uniref:glycosyltransferase family 2 protein n=1 Tax=Asinibacterium sp. OR53 TaxID=925409 RepID=UPI0004B7C0CF|nr:glycosyltransferase family 2 protein [Asinibacterium sp. OR53]